MVGRVDEQRSLDEWMFSGRPELIVVYGRRRVGKTYLIESYFRGRFTFSTTAAANVDMRTQLRLFHEKLADSGDQHAKAPSDWFEAFSRLRKLLCSNLAQRDSQTGRRVVFFDEMPWMDTPRSNFRAAFEFFWNDWASKQGDVLVIACGSATSWLVDNLLEDTGGMYRRVTGSINLQPLCLGECGELLRSNGLVFSRQQVIELYLAFGGIPYYLNLVRRGESPAQAVEHLCFAEGAPLQHEFELLLRTLFKKSDDHKAVMEALAGRAGGYAIPELVGKKGLPPQTRLRNALKELERCAFIRSSQDYKKRSRGVRYWISDPFCAFHLRFLSNRAFDSWDAHAGTPSFRAWRGLAFERACLAHLPQLKHALGIPGIETRTCSWHSEEHDPAAQVDLVVDRADGIIDLCEMKFSDAPYRLSRRSYEELVNKREVFLAETKTSKALHLVMVCASGLAQNEYALGIQAAIDAEALFKIL